MRFKALFPLLILAILIVGVGLLAVVQPAKKETAAPETQTAADAAQDRAIANQPRLPRIKPQPVPALAPPDASEPGAAPLERIPNAEWALLQAQTGVSLAPTRNFIVDAIPVTVNFAALEAARDRAVTRMPLELGLGAPVMARVTAVIAKSPTSYVLAGSVEDHPYSEFTLSVYEDAAVGHFQSARFGLRQLRYAGSGIHKVEEVNEALMPPCGVSQKTLPGLRGAMAAAQAAANRPATAASLTEPELPVSPSPSVSADPQPQLAPGDTEFDVLIAYTSATVSSQGGLNSLLALINLGVAETNLAFQTSNLELSLQLVGTHQTTYLDDAPLEALEALQRTADGMMDEIHSVRTALGADFVSLWIPLDLTAAGIGYLPFSLSVSQRIWAFNVVDNGAVTNYTFAHELGHNMGLAHAVGDGDPETEQGDGLFNYSHGWRWTGVNGTVYRSIMTYWPGTRVRHYSDPGVLYQGTATGVANLADSARSIFEAKTTWAAFYATAGPGTAPEIGVEQPAGTSLTDGTSSINYGSVALLTPTVRTFTIRNTGTGTLNGIELFVSGTHASNYVASGLGATSLAPNASTTFDVTFTPSGNGTRTATLRINSNDANENPFDIALTGSGFVPGPEIVVEQPAGTGLTDEESIVNFGNTPLTVGVPLTFTVRNTGTANLTSLSGSVSGGQSSQFSVGSLGSTTLAPGASTTVTVTFTPTTAGVKTTTFRIGSNDSDENPFDITITGTGLAPEIDVEQPAGTPLTDGGSTIDYGNSMLDAASQLTISVRNSGSLNLTNLTATVTGTHAAMFVPGSFGSTTLTPGAVTTFTLTFTPTSLGPKTAFLQIGSNDLDENPFNITLNGTGALPEIVVEHPAGTNLVDNTATINYGDCTIGVNTPRVFTVRNTGQVPLLGLFAGPLGGDSAMFTSGGFGTTSLAPGASATVTVNFNPTSPGTKTTTLRILSNDTDESPFEITLTGNGVAPEIAVELPDGTDLVDGTSTAGFGGVLTTGNRAVTFTIRNTGSSNLTGLSASINGTHAAMFTAGSFGATSVAPGSSTTLTVTFAPSSTGDKTAALHINSNDGNESPFDINLTGAGTGPEIAVENSSGVNLADNVSSVSLGVPAIGTSSQHVLTIRNAGTGELTGLAASVVGADAALFSAGAFGSTIVQPGSSTTVTISFSPVVIGFKTATLRIASTDSDENPFDLTLNGIGTNPEIVLEQPAGTGLTDGANTLDFGPVALGSSGEKTFTIKNLGTGALTNFGVTFEGDHAADYSAGAVVNPSINGGQSTTFTVSFSPSGPGTRNAVMRLANSDANENPFDVNLTGRTGIPEIEIEQSSGAAVVDGGGIVVGPLYGPETSVTKTFTIRNTGDAALSGLAASLTGDSQFSVSTFGSTSLAPGDSTTLVVTLSSPVNGAWTGNLQIMNNDPEESPFDIALSGERMNRTALNTWAESYGLTGAALLPAADTDGDSMVLIQEYAFGLNPTLPDAANVTPGTGSSGLPFISVVNDRLQVEYVRRRTDPGLRYEVQFGDGPEEASFAAATGAETITAVSQDLERVILQDTVTFGTHVRRFGRVKVSYEAGTP